MSANRTPDDILTMFDGAQEMLDGHATEYGFDDCGYNLRALLWEVLDDVISVGRDAASMASPLHISGSITGHEAVNAIEDFLVNNFGDD